MDLIKVSLVTLNNSTLIMFTYPSLPSSYVQGIYCILYHLLHLANAARPSRIHKCICTVHTLIPSPYIVCVYKVVVVNLLDITALPELEAQAFRYTRINIC